MTSFALSPSHHLREALLGHVPHDPTEINSILETVAFLGRVCDPFEHDIGMTHVTASAIVVDGQHRILVHRHKRLGIWLQPGGHITQGEPPAIAAQREVLEETGVRTHLGSASGWLVHVDAHDGPRGHRHLDLRYLLSAASTEIAPAVGESQHVAWVHPNDPRARTDDSLIAAVDAAYRHLANPNDV